MRLRGSLFWGIVLIVLGGLLFLSQQGWLRGDLFSYFWPAVVILFGIWLLMGAFSRRQPGSAGQNLSIPLEGVHTAHVKLDHGAGRLNIHSGASSTELLNGTFGTEVDYKSRVNGDQLQAKIRNSAHFWAWFPGENLDWDIQFNAEIPLELKIDSGASASTLDLTDLKVVELDIDTGASSTEVTLPANAGRTNVDIDSGAASLVIHVPNEVAARIRIKSGIASIKVDPNRFPHMESGFYQSGNYDISANRADISIDTGVGSVEIR
jgi:hypothetical protein